MWFDHFYVPKKEKPEVLNFRLDFKQGFDTLFTDFSLHSFYHDRFKTVKKNRGSSQRFFTETAEEQ